MSDSKNKAVCFLAQYGIPIETNNVYLGRNYEAQVCKERSVPYFTLSVDLRGASNPVPSCDEAAEILSKHKLTPYNGATMENGLIFPRSFCGYERAASNLIKELGADSNIGEKDIEIIDNWPDYVQSEFLKRKVAIIHASDLEKKVKEFSRRRKVFLKTKTKTSSRYGRVSGVKEATRSLLDGLPVGMNFHKPELGPLYFDIQPSTELIISEPLKIEKDANGILEYRSWIAEGEGATTERHSNPESIPEDIQDFVNSFVDKHKGILPDYYSMDIGVSKKEGPFVIELNQMSSYCWNGSPRQTMNIFSAILDNFLERDLKKN